MNNLRYLVRKDWQGRWIMILLWLALLVLGLLANLGITTREQLRPDVQSAISILQGPSLLLLSAFLASIIIVTTVREDTPAVRENFLSTRPVPPRALWLSKAAFLLLVIVLPVLLRNVLYLILSGQGLRISLLGTLQVALWVVPVTALLAGFSALWATRIRFAIALATASVAVWACALLADVFTDTPAFQRALFEGPVVFACSVGLAALAFLLLTAKPQWLRLPFRAKLPVAVLIPLGGLAFWLFGPAMTPSVSPVGTLPAVPVTGELSATETGYQYSWRRRHDLPAELSLQLNPDRPANLSPGQEIVWQFSEVTCNGQSHRSRVRDPLDLLRMSNLSRQLSLPMVRMVEQHLDQKPSWIVESPQQYSPSPPSQAIPAAPDSDQLLRFSATLKGSLYEWRVAADLPLTAGSSASDGQGEWTISYAEKSSSRGYFVVALQTSRPELWLSARPDDRASHATPYLRDASFVLYDPDRNRALFFDQSVPWTQSRAQATGYVHRSLELVSPFDRYSRESDRSNGDFTENLRLLILRPHYVGHIVRTWKALHGMRPAYLPYSPGSGLAQRERNVSSGQFAYWFDQLDKPSPDASSETIQAFLLAVVEQASHCRFSIHANDPVVADLALYVQRHLELFLRIKEALAMDDHIPSRLLIQAIIRGATPSQTDALVEALRRDHDLIQVLEARGWTRAALPTLREQFHAGSRGSIAVLARYGELDAQAPLLLAELRRDPRTHLYNILRSLPGIEPGLDRTVHTIWNERPRHISTREPFNSDPLRIALLHGLSEAVTELHSLVRQNREENSTNPSNIYQAGGLLQNRFLLEGVPFSKRHNELFVTDWFLARSPGDFHFDPISRRFALKPTPQASR